MLRECRVQKLRDGKRLVGGLSRGVWGVLGREDLKYLEEGPNTGERGFPKGKDLKRLPWASKSFSNRTLPQKKGPHKEVEKRTGRKRRGDRKKKGNP